MSIQAYLVRLRRYTKFDITCFPVAVLYLADLCEAHGPAFCPTYHNIHRLLVTALLVASKANDDVFHANFFMAQCGGINLAASRRSQARCVVEGEVRDRGCVSRWVTWPRRRGY